MVTRIAPTLERRLSGKNILALAYDAKAGGLAPEDEGIGGVVIEQPHGSAEKLPFQRDMVIGDIHARAHERDHGQVYLHRTMDEYAISVINPTAQA